jgi:hypothetical protein
MFRVTTLLAAVVLLALPIPAVAQSSASAPLLVTATVISSCRVNVPRTVSREAAASVAVAIRCARGAITPHVQNPAPSPRVAQNTAALVVINF